MENNIAANETPEKIMADLLPEIAAAKASHQDATRKSAAARHAETESFNRLNDLYKRYRAAADALVHSMPPATDWRDRTTRRESRDD
ncbi:hypothetical protein [Rhizobium sp. RU36D]|uniref:hypothetical protein n=1 Tax=Rhizobium sp. RU36D TaxID=1907415 RepID=UPI0009D7F716|nr:hypothetical protein [Rhizobium sp. RU36D]SMD18637.1 hypothetical protein SAMN05880593_13556 [Rhizobium sp. RU36D]